MMPYSQVEGRFHCNSIGDTVFEGNLKIQNAQMFNPVSICLCLGLQICHIDLWLEVLLTDQNHDYVVEYVVVTNFGDHPEKIT